MKDLSGDLQSIGKRQNVLGEASIGIKWSVRDLRDGAIVEMC